MLCQAILSAVAVTCTLSCIHALGQSTQRLDQIKDLMCMLILSGLQKDDLDASMLQKLQRHNVNIDDLNNEANINKCKHLNLQDIEKKIISTPVHTTMKSDDELTKEPSFSHKKKSILTLQESFLNPVKPDKMHVSQRETETTSATATSQYQSTDKEKIEYTNGKTRPEDVLKFWNNYATNRKDSIQTTSSSPNGDEENNSKNDQKNKKDIPKYRNAIDNYIINKDLSSVLSYIKRDDIEISTTQSSSPNNIYDEVLPFNEKPHNLEEINNNYSVAKILDKIESSADRNLLFDQRYIDMNSQEYSTPNSFLTFKEMLASIGQKTAYPFGYETVNKNKLPLVIESKIPNNSYLDTSFKTNNDMTKSNVIESSLLLMPHDIIKDIAANVKAIILQDIRKEIQTTTPITTSSTSTSRATTITPETTTQKDEIISIPIQKNDSALHQKVFDKFLELFEQIKSLNTKTLIITREDHNESRVVDNIEHFRNPITNQSPFVNREPMNQYVLPVNRNALPVNQDTLPVNQNTLPVNQKTLPVNQDTLTVNRNTLSLNQNILSVNRNSLPVNRNSLPVNQNSLPLNKNTLPGSQNSLPVNQHSFLPIKYQSPNDHVSNQNQNIFIPEEYNLSPQIHKYKSNFATQNDQFQAYTVHKGYNMSPQVHQFKSILVKQHKPQERMIQRGMPITLQTNALEIPPLGVYLNKPYNPISQNIIISTISPNQYRNERYIRYGSNSEDAGTNYNKNYEFYSAISDTQLPQSNYEKAELLIKPKYCATYDCSRLLRPKNNSKDGNNFKQASQKNKNLDRYMVYPSDTSHKKKHFNTSGFHEKLEKTSVENSKFHRYCCNEKGLNPKQLSVCCPQKISSRHQVSLNPVKRILYDDTHFKNFLKSQQKVTDMLERILAVNKLKSVELI